MPIRHCLTSRRWQRAGVRACALGILTVLPARAEPPWRRLQTPHFIILSAGSEAQARGWATDLEQFTAAMNAGFPARGRDLPPVTVVIFKHDRDFAPYKPLDEGRPAPIGGYFARSAFFDVIGLNGEASGPELRRTIFHEATHWFFSTRPHPLPLWAEEGIAEVYSTLRVTDAAHAVIGEPIPGHLIALRRGFGLGLPQLMGVTRATLHFNEAYRAGYFYAESWLLVHYALFASRSDRGATLTAFVAQLDQGADPEAALQICFGADYRAMQDRLWRYAVDGNYRTGIINLAAGPTVGALKSTPASPAELNLALGGLLAAARSPAEAEPRLEAAAAGAPKDPRAWEQLGDLALRGEDPGAAAADFSRAAAAGSRNFLTYFHLALWDLRTAAQPPGEAGPLAQAQSLLRTAIALRPDFLPAYQNLAVTIYSAPHFDPHDQQLMAAAMSLAPNDPALAIGAASAALRAGDHAGGRHRLKELLAHFPPTGSPHLATLARSILQADEELPTLLIPEPATP